MIRLSLLLATLGSIMAPVQGPPPAQGYGPAPVIQQHYEMYRGDTLEIPVGKPFSWSEVTGNAIAAQILANQKVRLVAIKPGTSLVSLKEDEILVWQAEVIVR